MAGALLPLSPQVYMRNMKPATVMLLFTQANWERAYLSFLDRLQVSSIFLFPCEELYIQFSGVPELTH